MKKEGWKIKKLGEVCDVRDGTHDSPKYQNEGFPLITSKNLTSGEINFENVNLISGDDFDKINKRSKVDIGDILMPMIGTIGNPVIVKTSKIFAIKNVALIKFKPSSEVLNRFIHFLLKGNLYSEKLLSLNKGGTQKFIGLGTIRNFLIPVPPLPIQEQIVKELDTLSDIIAKKRQQLAELDTLAQATFYDMFGDPVENEKGWGTTFIKDCLFRQTTINPQKEPKKRIKYVDISSVSNETFSIIGYNEILGKEAPSRARKIIKKDDILFATIRPSLKRIAIVNEKYDNEVCSTGFMVLRLKNNLNKYYLFNCLIRDSIISYIERFQIGAAYPAISEKIIENIKLPLPPLSLQNQFAERIETIEKQKELINKSITDVQLLFDYTMDKYFN